MRHFVTSLLLAGSALAPLPAMAQEAGLSDLQRQLVAMQAEIARLSAQVAELQDQAQAQASEPVASPAPTTAQPAAQDATPASIAWKGAPEITAPAVISGETPMRVA